MTKRLPTLTPRQRVIMGALRLRPRTIPDLAQTLRAAGFTDKPMRVRPILLELQTLKLVYPVGRAWMRTGRRYT